MNVRGHTKTTSLHVAVGESCLKGPESNSGVEIFNLRMAVLNLDVSKHTSGTHFAATMVQVCCDRWDSCKLEGAFQYLRLFYGTESHASHLRFSLSAVLNPERGERMVTYGC